MLLQEVCLDQWTSNPSLITWIKEIQNLCQPDSVYLCDGSFAEYQMLIERMASEGKLYYLNEEKRSGSIYFRSDVDDVARVEEDTFICSKNKEDAGPTNNWKSPEEMQEKLQEYFSGCMRGRVMYVIPFCMGPLGSKFSKIGVEISDSPYVVCNMRIMTRMGKEVLAYLKDEEKFIPCLHSVGVPLAYGEKDVPWPCNPSKRCIAHFPDTKSIFSFGSGYGGNALLGKKCLALRIASVMAKEEMWLAEHMLILGITSPEGEKKYFAAAFPSACGKTNLAMLRSTLPGWKIECVGDDIAWLRFSQEDGKLYAVNPEAGFFGVAPGTSMETNPNVMKTIEKNTIFTNVALTDDNDVYWEGMSKNPPINMTDWRGERGFLGKKNASHPNARFTTPITQCPSLDEKWNDPNGVCISAIIFGGRRDDVVPLVFQSFDWDHGTFLGASTSSQMTAAAQGELGKLRQDPFAMKPFCGYNMGKYFDHWLRMGKKGGEKNLPKIFSVNWFRKESDSFLWPGFGENIRVLKWIFERINGDRDAEKTPIGYIPKIEDLDVNGLDISKKTLEKLFSIDKNAYLIESDEIEKFFSQFGSNLPYEMKRQIDNLRIRLTKE